MSCAIANEPAVREHPPRAGTERVARYWFVLVSAMLFVASVAVTGLRMGAHSVMRNMSMPGHGAMSSPWMRAPGQGWVGAGTSFVGMWLAMTVAMMMPSTAPALWRYRSATVSARGTRQGSLAAAGAAYLVVWIAIGAIVFAIGASTETLQSSQPAMAHAASVVTGVVVLLAGAWQLTSPKARHLASCRREPAVAGGEAAGISAAARFGVRLGLHCMRSCANLMLVTLVAGVMNAPVMVAIAIAIAGERLAPGGDRVARATGVIVAIAGLYQIVGVLATG